METKKQNTRKMDLLSAVEQIVELAKGSHLEREFYTMAARPLKYLSEKMELTKEQSLMLSLFIDNSSNNRITVSDFATFLDCSTTRIIRFLNEIDVLEQRGLVCRSYTRVGNDYELVAKGTRHSVEFAAFLKEFLGEIPDYGPLA